MSIEWGPEIPVNGKRPVWLKDDERCRPRWGDSAWLPIDSAAVSVVQAWPNVTVIRLPADHWAYPVIAQGFEPWAGGDGPEDATGKVLFEDGSIMTSPVWNWSHDGVHKKIVGYRKHTEPAEQPEDDGDYVRVKRRSEAEWLEMLPRNNTLLALKLIGIIREETPLERFTRDNPDWRDKSVEEAVKLALEWRE